MRGRLKGEAAGVDHRENVWIATALGQKEEREEWKRIDGQVCLVRALPWVEMLKMLERLRG